MQIQITGKQLDVSNALCERIAAGLEGGITKYFQRSGEANVVVSRPSHLFEVDCSVHLDSGVMLQSCGEAGDAYAAFEVSLERMEKRLRRYKRRLKNHRARDPIPIELVAEKIIKPVDEDDMDDSASDGDAPAIILENGIALKTMTVSMAVMQLELAEAPALLFRNAAHGRLNMVYVRPDGNVGWVDPEKLDSKNK